MRKAECWNEEVEKRLPTKGLGEELPTFEKLATLIILMAYKVAEKNY